MKDRVDYAPHYLEAKKKLQEAYDMILEHKYTEALTLINEATVEMRLMRNAVKTHAE